MALLKKVATEPLAVAMTGVTLGNRVVVVGATDPALIAALAIKAGLTGRTCVVDADAARLAETARAVEREGGLVEPSTAPLTTLPYEAGAFDVAVLRDVLGEAAPATRQTIVAEVERVLRPGGRCIVIDTSARGGFGGWLAKPVSAEYFAAGGAPPILTAVGFAAVRTLAERERMAFTEGVKRNG